MIHDASIQRSRGIHVYIALRIITSQSSQFQRSVCERFIRHLQQNVLRFQQPTDASLLWTALRLKLCIRAF